jgi:hypothetical protein
LHAAENVLRKLGFVAKLAICMDIAHSRIALSGNGMQTEISQQGHKMSFTRHEGLFYELSILVISLEFYCVSLAVYCCLLGVNPQNSASTPSLVNTYRTDCCA